MNITGIRPSTIPAPRSQERPAVPDGSSHGPGATPHSTPAPAPAPAAGVQDARAALSEAEQRFFEELYPGAVQDLRTSPAYARTGLQPDQRTGMMFDRKG